MDSDNSDNNDVILQTIKTNLTRDNEFVRDSMTSLTNQFKRYENYSNIMMSIKKEISSLSLQLLQKDSSESKAQVRRNACCLFVRVYKKTARVVEQLVICSIVVLPVGVVLVVVLLVIVVIKISSTLQAVATLVQSTYKTHKLILSSVLT